MTGSIVGVYNGKVFTQVRLDMMKNPVKKKRFLSCDENSW